jgi:hypothetical protein
MFPPPTKIGLKTLRKMGRRAGMAEAYETNIEIMDIYIMQELDMNVLRTFRNRLATIII